MFMVRSLLGKETIHLGKETISLGKETISLEKETISLEKHLIDTYIKLVTSFDFIEKYISLSGVICYQIPVDKKESIKKLSDWEKINLDITILEEKNFKDPSERKEITVKYEIPAHIKEKQIIEQYLNSMFLNPTWLKESYIKKMANTTLLASFGQEFHSKKDYAWGVYLCIPENCPPTYTIEQFYSALKLSEI